MRRPINVPVLCWRGKRHKSPVVGTQKPDVGFVRLQPLQVGRKAVKQAECAGEPKRRHGSGIRKGKLAPALGERVVEPGARPQHEVRPGFVPPQQPAVQQAARTLFRRQPTGLLNISTAPAG